MAKSITKYQRDSERRDVCYDAAVKVHDEGNVEIIPAPYESDKEPVTPRGGVYASRGIMVMQADGNATFRPYRHTEGARYDLIDQTEHGKVKAYPRSLVVSFVFPIEMEVGERSMALARESWEIANRM